MPMGGRGRGGRGYPRGACGRGRGDSGVCLRGPGCRSAGRGEGGGASRGEEASLPLRLGLLVGVPLAVVLVVVAVAFLVRFGCVGADVGVGPADEGGPAAGARDAGDGLSADVSWDADDGLPVDVDSALAGVFGGGIDAERGCDPAVVEALDVPPTCVDGGRLVETVRQEGAMSATWGFDEPLPDVMTRALEGFQADGSLRLTFGAYLDLFQRVWGGTLASDEGWSEIIVGQEVDGEGVLDGSGVGTADGTGSPGGDGASGGDARGRCRLTLVRLEAGALSGLAGGDAGGDVS